MRVRLRGECKGESLVRSWGECLSNTHPSRLPEFIGTLTNRGVVWPFMLPNQENFAACLGRKCSQPGKEMFPAWENSIPTLGIIATINASNCYY